MLQNQGQLLISDIRNKEDSISDTKLSISGLNHISSDLNFAQSDLYNLAETEKTLNNFWDDVLNKRENISLNWKKKSAESVNASLTRMFSRWRQSCRKDNVAMPSNENLSTNSSFLDESTPSSMDNYGFAFSSYDGSWPSFSAEEAQQLGIQIEIINEIINALCYSTDGNHSISIVSLKRENAGQIDNGNIGVDKLRVNDVAPFLLRQNQGITSYAFEIVLQCQTYSVRKFLNLLRPPFMIRKLSLTPFEESDGFSNTGFAENPNPFSAEPSAAIGATSDQFLPIVSQVDSRATILVEYVTNIDKSISILHRTKSIWSGANPDIYIDWLKKSGNVELVDVAQKLFDKDDR
ncbi:MAG: hypothetical protein VX467_03000 [Verrucomicrobiota bacterium]|nr:hypothetical protein [Verrucomicrobiota bacterium]